MDKVRLSEWVRFYRATATPEYRALFLSRFDSGDIAELLSALNISTALDLINSINGGDSHAKG